MAFKLILLLIIAYLIGSIPTSLWLGKLWYKTDVREFGSGNSGATNVLRVLGLKIAIPVLIIDIIKGFAATQLAWFIRSSYSPYTEYYKAYLGASAILGHILPLLAKFKGGKGIATTFGVIIGLAPVSALICVGVFLIVTALSRYVSLGSLLTFFVFPFVFIFIVRKTDLVFILFSIFTFITVVITHRFNIQRLITGSETIISFRKKVKDKYYND
jgi:glycerol-3-phosphate acyltransferase PlsY